MPKIKLALSCNMLHNSSISSRELKQFKQIKRKNVMNDFVLLNSDNLKAMIYLKSKGVVLAFKLINANHKVLQLTAYKEGKFYKIQGKVIAKNIITSLLIDNIVIFPKNKDKQ